MMPDLRPRFDYSLNFGHIVQAAMLLIVVLGFGWRLIVWQENINTAIASQSDALKGLQTTVLPLVQTNTLSNKLQDERIDSMKKSLDTIQLSNQQILNSLYAVRETVAAIKARQNDRQNNPR